MAHALKLNVVAEGVENAEQLKFLHAQRCDSAQGYFLFRPLPQDEVADVLKINWREHAAPLAIPA